ncbi:hypothetical protein SxD43FB_13945 [Sphingobium sp. D43FB]|nr:hypothetical protein SxD43FB_13945 [Sphingobium sp. D43FB]
MTNAIIAIASPAREAVTSWEWMDLLASSAAAAPGEKWPFRSDCRSVSVMTCPPMIFRRKQRDADISPFLIAFYQFRVD